MGAVYAVWVWVRGRFARYGHWERVSADFGILEDAVEVAERYASSRDRVPEGSVRGVAIWHRGEIVWTPAEMAG